MGWADIFIWFGVVTKLPDARSPALILLTRVAESGIRFYIPRDISRKDIFPKSLGSVSAFPEDASLEDEAIFPVLDLTTS